MESSDVEVPAETISPELGPHYLRSCSSESLTNGSSADSSFRAGTRNREPDLDQGPEDMECMIVGPGADHGNPQVSQYYAVKLLNSAR